ncbi:hypothetical protein NHX12_026116 [Muraenolepis orangiensis]|uniref:Transcription initiation factor IIA subunit 1 n=1 Tax=Muraenolepis orangiensis TaxID=630683 RepID=A0A9Q0IQG3_9TELE|nr:hypothetical protein NHX12_026116 [Muraenolepis orangiensis]
MASSANSNPVPKLYRGVIEDVINEVRELFLDEGVDEQVLLELKTLWENKLTQSKAVEGFHSEEQAVLLATQQAQQAHHTAQPAAKHVLQPLQQQAPQQQVIVQDPKILQHMGATGMSAAATAATLALPTGVTPYQQLITSQGQILQVAPVIQQVLAPIQGGLPQQTGVIIQPQQLVLASGNKVQGNTQVMQTMAQPGQEPLNSGDDVSDEEDQELFDTENVVVCQYDKIHRSKNKWKFHLKDGIMNLNGRDYVFSKAIGDAEW